MLDENLSSQYSRIVANCVHFLSYAAANNTIPIGSIRVLIKQLQDVLAQNMHRISLDSVLNKFQLEDYERLARLTSLGLCTANILLPHDNHKRLDT